MTITHLKLTEIQWLKARGLIKETYDGPMYLIACGRAILIGENTTIDWNIVTCEYCLNNMEKE